jgi:2-polyprenyl-3-methyl-5-hydroxy-6-metoxy-1,4-benzoquinol methylase
MAKFNLDYYKNTDFYSDGDIENDILSLVEDGFDISKGEGAEKYPFAVAYHLSPERENILNWYPFKKNASCLEIGAGCGAVTGMLCRKAGKVVSVDISKRRSEINYKRHKDCENLEIIAGNFQEIIFEDKFDYVILNGVFEYAISFIHTDKNPYTEFLKMISTCLKSDGKILIAIENRLGLKYFNGAVEDHTDNYFLGLNDYQNNDSVRTFSKSELSELIAESGFDSDKLKFYYPYPDYKFPSEIFTDKTINTQGYGTPYMNLGERNFGLYSEQRVAASLAGEGVLDRFANSFLVEICGQNTAPENIAYVKLNTLRRDEYKIMTVITDDNGKKAAYKLPVGDKANKHLENMVSGTGIAWDGVKNLEPQRTESGLKYPFVTGKSLNSVLTELAQSGDKEGIVSALKLFFDRYRKGAVIMRADSDEFKSVFGKAEYNGELLCIKPANIDLICDNIFPNSDGTYTVIDNEWTLDMYIPLGFIIWRSINELIYKNKAVESVISSEELFDEFDIDEEMRFAFVSWAVHFADKYVGNNYLAPYAIPVNQLSLMDIYNNRREKREFSTSCYYDRGNGFSEEDKAFELIKLDEDGGFSVKFPVPEDVIGFRWDVAEGVCIKCKIDSVETNGTAALTADNAVKENGFDVFYTGDPHYTLTGGADEVRISGSITYISDSELLAEYEKRCASFRDESGRLNERLAEQQSVIAEQSGVIEQRNKQIEENVQTINLDSRYISSCEDRIKQYYKNTVTLNLELERRDMELEMYKQLTASRAWRFTNKLWRITGALKRLFGKLRG